MRFKAGIVSLLSLLPTIYGLYASQANVIDWHEPYIGIPLTANPALAPRIHRVVSADPSQPPQSVFLSASKANIISGLNPTEGNIVWRRQLLKDDPIVAFKANLDGIIVLSGYGGATARLYEVINGNLIWQTHLHQPLSSSIHEGEPTGAAIAFDSLDIFVLSKGNTVKRLGGAKGEVKWSWTSEDQGSSTFFSSLIRTNNGLYTIGLTQGIRTFQLHIVSLDPESGSALHTSIIPSEISSTDGYIVLVSPNRASAAVTWIENGNLKLSSITPNLDKIRKATNLKGDYISVEGLGIQEKGYFLAKKADGTAHVYRLERDGLSATRAGEFTSTDAQFTVFGSGLDKTGAVYIAKLSQASTLKTASYEVFVPNAIGGQGMTTGFTFPYDVAAHSAITSATIDVVNPKEYTYVSRIILSTSAGGIQQWKQDTLSWTREESLTEIVAVTAVELPEYIGNKAQAGGRMYGRTEEEAIWERIARQMGEIQGLPQFLFHFVQRFVTGTYSKSSSVPTPTDYTSATTKTGNFLNLWRDTYGFKKLIIAATSTGKVFGIETTRGKIVWSIKLGSPGVDTDVIRPLRFVVLKSVKDGVLLPEVGLVVEVTKASGAVTGIVHMEALTGKSLPSTIQFSGPTLETFELNLPQKGIAMVDHDFNLHIYPNDEETSATFNNLSSVSGFALAAGIPESHCLTGFGYLPKALDQKATKDTAIPVWKTYEQWKTVFAPYEMVVSVVRQSNPTQLAASHGRVLGDRTTLYKYLNPHLIAVVTRSINAAPFEDCTIHLVDGGKGTIVWSAKIVEGGAKGSCQVTMTLVENWLVYHYYDDGRKSIGGTKGWRMVSLELYEGEPDKKSKSRELSHVSSKRAAVTVLEQSFVFPHGVQALATTTTKFGISSKDIVAITDKGQVQTFPRRLLDPRRPKSKPTAQQQEEMLIQYDPLLPDDPRRVVSHGNQLIVDKLLTTGTQLESTSLIFAYGVDMFLTRVSPSNTFDVLSEHFNKIQLVLTVLGLGAAILITKPIVRGRKLKSRWYS